MVKRIRIKAGLTEAVAELNDTATARAIWEALPITGQANLWGDEIYFSIPVKMELENGQKVVKAGNLGYWPPGSALCIFFGLTPASSNNEIRAASAVTMFGQVTGDLSVFRQVASGVKITVEQESPVQ